MTNDYLYDPQLIPVLLLLTLTLLVVFLFIIGVVILKRRPRTPQTEPSTMGTRIKQLEREVRTLTTRVSNLLTANTELEKGLKDSLSCVGLVRYSAFADTGSDLSFSLAILDQHGNGFVITSLYGRSEGRVYAKPVRTGTSPLPLSEEEAAAIAAALK